MRPPVGRKPVRLLSIPSVDELVRRLPRWVRARKGTPEPAYQRSCRSKRLSDHLAARRAPWQPWAETMVRSGRRAEPSYIFHVPPFRCTTTPQRVSTGVLRTRLASLICLTRKSATSAREIDPERQSRASTRTRHAPCAARLSGRSGERWSSPDGSGV